MKKVYAYVNEGRTIADCPNCNGAEFVKKGEPFICSHCHPEVRGSKSVQVQGYTVAVNDPTSALEARQRIIAGGGGMDVIFPADFEEILNVLHLRPSMQNMNWRPGETLQDLTLENVAHGAPMPGGAL